MRIITIESKTLGSCSLDIETTQVRGLSFLLAMHTSKDGSSTLRVNSELFDGRYQLELFAIRKTVVEAICATYHRVTMKRDVDFDAVTSNTLWEIQSQAAPGLERANAELVAWLQLLPDKGGFVPTVVVADLMASYPSLSSKLPLLHVFNLAVASKHVADLRHNQMWLPIERRY